MTTRIGLLFGSFDPTHTGHLHIAHQTLRQGLVQQVEFVLTPQSPFKNDNTLAPTHHRLLMLKCALKNTPYRLNETELKLPAPHYTVQTLQKIKERRPENSFCLLMGEDQLCSLHRWKDIESIQSCVDKFLVYHRNGTQKSQHSAFLQRLPLSFVQGKAWEVSSSEIRRCFKQNKPLPVDGLPKGVESYVRKHGLYGCKRATSKP